jgi:hypothetical protein
MLLSQRVHQYSGKIEKLILNLSISALFCKNGHLFC